MKPLFLNLVVLSLLTTGFVTVINACHKQDSSQPPVVVATPAPSVVPSATPVATATPSATPVAVVCASNPKVSCSGAKFQGCDGFADVADLAAKAKADNMSSCIKVDGVDIFFGFGPCLTCQSIK